MYYLSVSIDNYAVCINLYDSLLEKNKYLLWRKWNIWFFSRLDDLFKIELYNYKAIKRL